MIQEALVAAAVEQGFPVKDVDTQTALLFRDHLQRVLRAAYRITGSMADAEDVAQIVFARLTQAAASQAVMANPESYLYRAAVNAALDMVRKRQRENSVSLELVLDHPSAATADPLESSYLKTSLRRALAEIEGRAAEMFAMH